MHFIDSSSYDPCYNLAYEEVLFRKAEREGRAFASLWNNSPAVIVGRYQNARAEVDVSLIEARGIALVRRITGGGAVYQDLGNLNYTFVVPRREGESHDFARFGETIVAALAGVGVSVACGGRNDIATTCEGKKISGTAQHASKAAVLHHGTLLFDVDLDLLGQVLTADPAKFESKALPSVRSRVANIKELLSAPMSMSEFRERIRACLDLPEETLSPEELREVDRLAEEKYRTWEWNWGKSPAFTERKKRRFSWGSVEALFDVQNGVIANCRFFGDFFGAGTEDVEKALTGLAYKAEDIRKALRPLPLDRCFAGADENEVLSLLCD